MAIALELPLPAALPMGWTGSWTLTGLVQALGQAGIELPFDDGADLEDATELAGRTLAGAAVLPGLGIVPTVRAPDGRVVRLDGGDAGEDLDHRRLGVATGAAEARKGARAPSAFDVNPAYWSSPAFRDHAGRAVRLCGNSDEGDGGPAFADLPYLRDALPAFAAAHGKGAGREVAHKFVGLGLKEWPVTFAPAGLLMSELGFAMERNHRGGSLLQEVAEMAHEYRFLVVGHRIVGGSWTRSELTADDARMDLTAEGPHGTPIDARPTDGLGPMESRATALGHAAFAADALRALEAEGRLSGDFTLDVFVDPATGRRGIVEMNPIGLAGWFAADPKPVVAALGTRLAGRG